MSEIFIKNNRRRVVQDVQKKAYTPEYKRLGITPAQVRESDPADFEKYNKLIKKEDTNKQRNQALISFVKDYRNGKISKEELEEVLGTDVLEDASMEIKRERALSVGQNEDLVWTKDQVITGKKVYNEPIEVEEVFSPPLTPAQQALEDDEEFSFSQVNIGEYILLHEESVVVAGSKKKVVETLVELLENSEEADVSEFLLLKRVNLKYGLLVDEG